MICHKLSNTTNIKKIMQSIGSTNEGIKIMSLKAKNNFFYIKHIKAPAANILKQEALSVGGDLAVPKDTIYCKDEFINTVLIVTDAQLKVLIQKLAVQPFGLAKLVNILKEFLHVNSFDIKIMGVLNANEDSFFDKSRYSGQDAVARVSDIIEQGAQIVDLGGLSSRPGSKSIDEKDELQRIKYIIDGIYENKLYENAIFSLDSYSPLCLKYAFDRGFKIANDITALENDEVAKICASYNATVCLMHMQNDPNTMQENPFYEDVIEQIDTFFQMRIEKAKSFGIKDIILDVGIGFGKNLQHNLTLLKHQEHFLHHGYELLVGASRKSMIDKIYPSSIQERLPGTLAIHLQAIKNGASIIRCHDVKEHKQAIMVYEAIENTI